MDSKPYNTHLANAYLQIEAIRALNSFAAWAADSSPDQFIFSAEAATAFALKEGGSIIETAIQMHGGIGFTYEYDLHLYLRRVKMIEGLLFSSEFRQTACNLQPHLRFRIRMQ